MATLRLPRHRKSRSRAATFRPAIILTLNTTVNPANVAAINAAKSYIITGSGAISGASGVNVSGAGSLTLATSNTYTGGTLVSAPGQLNINFGGGSGESATNSAI